MQQIEVSSVGASAGCLLSGNSVQRLILGRNLNDAIDPQRTKRLKELETENGRLRRAVSDLTLDKLILAEAAKGTSKPLAPPRLRGSCDG